MVKIDQDRENHNQFSLLHFLRFPKILLTYYWTIVKNSEPMFKRVQFKVVNPMIKSDISVIVFPLYNMSAL
jgi:hypothetical protein